MIQFKYKTKITYIKMKISIYSVTLQLKYKGGITEISLKMKQIAGKSTLYS